MMGLEPTTFCMASASDVRVRSLEFAQEHRFPGPLRSGANPSEPERTPNLAILATLQDQPEFEHSRTDWLRRQHRVPAGHTRRRHSSLGGISPDEYERRA
jgi:hypothetical protein